jgi:hypothetical protein
LSGRFGTPIRSFADCAEKKTCLGLGGRVREANPTSLERSERRKGKKPDAR